jgi:putative transposase
VIYTTNAIEILHKRLCEVIKSRSHFPSDAAAITLLWLALQNLQGHTVRSAKAWHDALNQFPIVDGDRFAKRPA